jgi:hypothetical protein
VWCPTFSKDNIVWCLWNRLGVLVLFKWCLKHTSLQCGAGENFFFPFFLSCFSLLSFRFHNVIYFFLLYNLSFFFLFNFFLSSLNLFENGKSNQFFTQSNTNPKLGCFFLLHEKSTKRNGNKISNPIVKLINIKDRIKHDKKRRRRRRRNQLHCVNPQ